MILNYHDECLQSLLDEWWVKHDVNELKYQRGRLIKVFVPHVDQNPFALIPIGRANPTLHDKAVAAIEPINIKKIIRETQLPVAGIPQYKNEIRAVYRAKKRPAIILFDGSSKIEGSWLKDKPKWMTNRTIIAAPFYGGDENFERAGFPKEFIERIKKCEYPQYMWDSLPLNSKTNDSILRLDHLLPIGRNEDSIEFTDYCLHEKALKLLDEQLSWYFYGVIDISKGFGEWREILLSS